MDSEGNSINIKTTTIMIIAKEINDKIYIYNYKNRRVYCFNKGLARLLASFFGDENAGRSNHSKKERNHYKYFKKEHLLS
ncbi:MAG: hypothetical protein Q8N16_00950 [bacterium]|nr:hypothetical protein [bacterium]